MIKILKICLHKEDYEGVILKDLSEDFHFVNHSLLLTTIDLYEFFTKVPLIL